MLLQQSITIGLHMVLLHQCGRMSKVLLNCCCLLRHDGTMRHQRRRTLMANTMPSDQHTPYCRLLLLLLLWRLLRSR